MQKNIFEDISTDIIKSISKDNNEPHWMLEFRLENFEKFQESSFEQSNLFTKYNDFLTGFNSGIVNFEKKNIQSKIKTEHRGKHINFLQVNGEMVEKNIESNNKNNNIILTDISDAIKKYPDIVKSYLEKNHNRDKFEYLSNALFTTGLFIHIPKNTQIIEPIRYINRQENLNEGVFNKNIIILEDNSIFNLFTEYYSSTKFTDKDSIIFGYSQDIFVGNDTKLTVTEMELFNKNVFSFLNKRTEVGNGSSVKMAVGYLGGKISRSRSYSNLIGENSTVEDLHVLVGTNEEKYDLVTSIYHSGKGTKGIVDVKGVLSGKSQMTLKGMNKIEKQAHNSDTFLGGHAIILGNEARANIIPGLEINNRNVKAKHSAAVAPINEDLLFYLQSRSLNKDTSVKLILGGFLESILKRIEIPVIKEQIQEMIDYKLKDVSSQVQEGQLQEGQLQETSAEKGKFKKVCKLSDVQNGEMRNIFVENKNILIANINNKIFATSGQCTHQEVNLEDGFLLDGDITCPLHLSKFSLNTGKPLNPPAIKELLIYNIKIQDEEIYVEID